MAFRARGEDLKGGSSLGLTTQRGGLLSPGHLYPQITVLDSPGQGPEPEEGRAPLVKHCSSRWSIRQWAGILLRLTPTPPQTAFSIPFTWAGLKAFIPGRESPGEVVNREAARKNTTKPSKAKGSPVRSSRQRSRGHSQGQDKRPGPWAHLYPWFSSVCMEASQRCEEGWEGRKEGELGKLPWVPVTGGRGRFRRRSPTRN